MSMNPIEMRTCATGRYRMVAALTCGMAAGLVASGCGGDSEAACTSSHDGLRAFVEVRDRDGACTECNAEDGLTFVAGLANGCNDVARFTTPDTCLAEGFFLVTDSGEMIRAGYGCAPAVTEWELQPGQVEMSEMKWELEGELTDMWGPPEPGQYRFVMKMATDPMTEMEIAAPVEVEITVTEP